MVLLCLPVQGCQAELTWVAGYIQDGIPACRRSPILVLTEPNVEFVDRDQHTTIKLHCHLIITVIKEYGLTDQLINKTMTQKVEFVYKNILTY